MTKPLVHCHINNHLFSVATWLLLHTASALPCQAQTETTDHYTRAVELLQDGMLEKAMEICEEGLRNTPQNPQLAYLLGQTLFRHAQQLEQRNDPRVPALFQSAKQRLIEAEANSQRPLDAGLDHALGSIMLREQNFNKAVNRFTSAIAKAPDKSIFYRMRGHTYLQMSKYVPAQKDLQKAVKLDPANHSSQTFLAESFFRSGKIEIARQTLWDYYSRLPDKGPNPRHAHTLFKIYEYALAANELSDARKALELGLERKPGDNTMQLELAILLYRLGEFTPAADLLEARAFHHAGADGIDVDVVGAELEGHRLGVVDVGGFAGAVGDGAAGANDTGDAGGVGTTDFHHRGSGNPDSIDRNIWPQRPV